MARTFEVDCETRANCHRLDRLSLGSKHNMVSTGNPCSAGVRVVFN